MSMIDCLYVLFRYASYFSVAYDHLGTVCHVIVQSAPAKMYRYRLRLRSAQHY